MKRFLALLTLVVFSFIVLGSPSTAASAGNKKIKKNEVMIKRRAMMMKDNEMKMEAKERMARAAGIKKNSKKMAQKQTLKTPPTTVAPKAGQ